jgi:hypothetical protein
MASLTDLDEPQPERGDRDVHRTLQSQLHTAHESWSNSPVRIRRLDALGELTPGNRPLEGVAVVLLKAS